MLVKKYIFPTVKSALLLLFYFFTYCWLDPLLRSGPFFVSWSFLSKLNMDFRGKVWKRVWKMTVFSLKHGKGLENHCRKHTPTWSSSQPSGAQNLERATSMHSVVKASSRTSLFLEPFWREFWISFKFHKPVLKTYRPKNNTLWVLITFSFHFAILYFECAHRHGAMVEILFSRKKPEMP